jgi:peptidoglycan/LPS O-acetylase OafA/YrhL
MGTIRLLLALAVTLYHSYGIFSAKEDMTAGMVSVQAFYMISGFYMALILNEKYKAGPGSYRLFITSRFLRIYPVYWVCLLLVVLVCIAGEVFLDKPFYLWYWTSQWATMHWTTIVFFLFANIFLFGSDWMMFMNVNKQTGLLETTANPFSYKPMAGEMLFLPQSWSVGTELSFYLIAPFLVRLRWFWQLAIVILSLGFRYYACNTKFLYYDPWSYRFFPMEIALFMGGSLAYQAYLFLREKPIPNYFNLLVWLLVLGSIVFYPHIDWIGETKLRWYFYAFFLLTIPFVFMLTKNYKWDRLIGELSFPVYVSHHVIMFLWRQYFFTHAHNMKWFGIVTALSTLIFAFLLWKFLIIPLEKYRQKRNEKSLNLSRT